MEIISNKVLHCFPIGRKWKRNSSTRDALAQLWSRIWSCVRFIILSLIITLAPVTRTNLVICDVFLICFAGCRGVKCYWSPYKKSVCLQSQASLCNTLHMDKIGYKKGTVKRLDQPQQITCILLFLFCFCLTLVFILSPALMFILQAF